MPTAVYGSFADRAVTMRTDSEADLLELYANWSSSELKALQPELQLRVQHARLHEKHKGHDQMHAQMLLIFFSSVVIGQVCLVQWKKRHFKSYQMATMFWMWLIPLVMCLSRGWWRFVASWSAYSLLTLFIVSRARQKQIAGTTPRLVYKWFLLMHKASYVLGIIGYVIVLFTFTGIARFFGMPFDSGLDAGVLLMFYGVYYGVLSRDFAQICTDTMAAHIGYTNSDGLPSRALEDGVCAVCGGQIATGGGSDCERTYRLNCGHLFHEFCIRGWCIVGKNQTCPYCREKVDLKQMFRNPWEKPDIMYGQLLDFVRYLVAWQPLIISVVHGISSALGLE